MTFEQAVAASQKGTVCRYRYGALLMASAPKNTAHVYVENLDLFRSTILSEKEKQETDWQPMDDEIVVYAQTTRWTN